MNPVELSKVRVSKFGESYYILVPMELRRQEGIDADQAATYLRDPESRELIIRFAKKATATPEASSD